MSVATRDNTIPFTSRHLVETRPMMRLRASELHHRLAVQGVIAFRRQQCDDDDVIEVLQRLGELTFTQGEIPVEGYPKLNVVSNIGKENPKSVFHSDTSYIRNTPAYTMLRPIEIPEQGGATLFTNQFNAWNQLPEFARDRLANVEALHVVTGLDEKELDETQAWHPVARQHPRSGRVALFLTTPKRCQQLREKDGVLIGESQRWIRLLYRHSINRCPVYRHHWELGDIVIWDNRCTMHRGDHHKVIGKRVFHRGMAVDVNAPQSSER